MHPEKDLFEEAKLLHGLSKKSEKSLIDCLYSYIVEIYSSEPAQREIVACCKAIIQLFPHLETTPSEIGGIVSENLILEFIFFSHIIPFPSLFICFVFHSKSYPRE